MRWQMCVFVYVGSGVRGDEKVTETCVCVCLHVCVSVCFFAFVCIRVPCKLQVSRGKVLT
jgi:hypothetical protein